MYFDKKEAILNFSHLYIFSQNINKCFSEEIIPTEIQEICSKRILIPKSDGVIAIYIINSSGHLLFSKINGNKSNLKEYEIQISGFITAISIFSKEIISRKPQTKLKQINFGDQHFYLNLKSNIIFAFLVQGEKITELTKRYIRLISDDFLETYDDIISSSRYICDLTKFKNFEKIIDNYFII